MRARTITPARIAAAIEATRAGIAPEVVGQYLAEELARLSVCTPSRVYILNPGLLPAGTDVPIPLEFMRAGYVVWIRGAEISANAPGEVAFGLADSSGANPIFQDQNQNAANSPFNAIFPQWDNQIKGAWQVEQSDRWIFTMQNLSPIAGRQPIITLGFQERDW